jgi:energy-coupling factor transporter ATP-binding protein EcfA2
MNKKHTLIKINNFSFTYPTGENLPALTNIDLQIDSGALTVLCGVSGSGKTTLLRHLKPELSPKGKTSGSIDFSERIINSNSNKLGFENRNSKISFVMQNPSNQIVMDSVWHELAFGLENQGIRPEEIERRIAEIANFFGIESWIDKRVAELSGGEKQILNLASNMILQPDLLVLDEPTAQLDPIARRDFLQMLFYIHAETGTAIVISEHNLDDLLENADQVIFLDQGRIDYRGTASGLTSFLLTNKHPYQKALPISARAGSLILEDSTDIPLSIKQGRDLLLRQKNFLQTTKITSSSNSKKQVKVMQADRLWYRYKPEDELVLKEADLKVFDNEILVLMGGNGSGKSTLLYLLSKALAPLKGKISISSGKRVAMLGQNPEAVFAQDTVDQVIREYQDRFENTEQEITEIVERLGIEKLLKRHPYDLSGGEKQKVALAKAILTKPDILLLDEPIKGLDVLNKAEIKQILFELKEKMSLVLVTHDIDFAAEVADRCAMIFNNRVIAVSAMEEFFQKNSYFTTTTYRLTRDIIEDCIVFEDLEMRLQHDHISNQSDISGPENPTQHLEKNYA